MMLGQLNKALLYLLLCGMSLQLTAQQYGYVQYSMESEAPFDQVSTVLQDQAGFVWIGGQNGLYRFDGIQFEMYSKHTRSQSIHQLIERDNQLLFINDIGVYQIDDLNAQPTVSPVLEGTIDESAELPFYPNDFVVGQDQTLWLSQSNHTVGHLQQGEFKTYHFSETEKEQKLALQTDSHGGIWALSPVDGLFHFDASANDFVQKLELDNGTSLLIHDDYLLVGSDALRVYSITQNRPRLIKRIELDDDLVTAMYVDQNDHYFIGTQNGKLYRLTDWNEQLQAVYGANEAHRVEQLDFGFIHEIYVVTDTASHHDKLWVCSETGLWLLQERFFETVENLPMVNPISISIGNNGLAWSPINYLFEISPQEEKFTAEPILNNIQVTSVAQDKAGFLWVGTSNPRIELSKYANNRLVKRYREFHERGESIFNLFPDSQGNIWFCQAPLDKPIIGIAKIDAQGAVTYYDETRGFSSRVLAIKEGARGEIYAAGIGETGYLYRFEPEQDRFVNLSPPLPFTAMFNFEAHDLTVDDRGVVWLATTDGLLRYDGEKIALIENDVLGQEEVRGVTHYSNNNIWVSTATKGLVFHRQNTSTVLGEMEGLPAIISAYRCITTDSDGRLWAGTAEGLVYSRSSAATLPYSNPPTIHKISMGRQEYSGRLRESIAIRKGQTLNVYFTNLSYPSRNVEYQYRQLFKEDRSVMLEEQHWVSVGSTNNLELRQTETGNYYLELRARQPGGYQWSAPVEMELTVFLPWYQQTWFIYGLMGLLLVGVVYYFRAYVQRRLSKLQQVLRSSNEALAEKEIQLHQKIQEFEEQQEELNNANSNIQTLELFIEGIPRKASWNDIITAMGKAVNQLEDINAFEIAFKEGNEIVHKGYSNQERSGYTFRSKPFDAKTSLTCWAMTNNQEVLINDFHTEHTLYIDQKAAYRFRSLLFIPFKLENNQPVVLCAYSIDKNSFDPNDLVMFRILAQFIYLSIHEEIKKTV